ncbi:MAG: 30S ribosomal protein S20 [Firmicutes bacterium]|nr:30S ribosomal protein S20 [Bacillota bacterium]
MPNIKSAKKRVLVSAKKRANNVAHKSALKTAIKRFEVAVSENREDAQEYLVKAIKALDKAASKGVIHKNAAARKKSRLTKKLAAASQQ